MGKSFLKPPIVPNSDDYFIAMYHKDKYAIVPISWQAIDDDNDKLWAVVIRNLLKELRKDS